MLETQRNIDQLIVVKNIDRAASAGDTISSTSDLSDGEVVWVTPGNQVVDDGSPDAASYQTLRLMWRNGDDIIVSDDIDVSTITHYSVTAYSAPADQVDYIGYNGSSGSIEEIAENLYYVRMFMQGLSATDFGTQTIKQGVYKSGATANQYDIAIGLAQSLVYNFKVNKKNQEGHVVADAVTSAAVTAGNAFDNNATVVKGSEYVTVGTNLEYGGAALAVGDYVRVGDVAGGTELTDPVYKVTELTSTTVFKVDRPITEASGTYAPGTADLEVIPAATGQAADWGVKLVGQDNRWTLGRYNYRKVRWDLQLEDFGDTTITTGGSGNSVAPVEGTGYYKQVKELEYFLQGNEGAALREQGWGPDRDSRDSVSTSETYDLMQIRHGHPMTSTLGKSNTSPKQLTLALAVTDNGSNQIVGGTNPDTCVATVADDWIVSSWAITGMSAQAGNLT